jgi:YidC/Oxa1 family membrane protein insertase
VNIFQPLLQFLGQIFGPIGTLFHNVIYLPIFNILMLLYGGVHFLIPSAGFPSLAIAIFLLTVAVRLCLYPLTRKQLQSSRAMQALAPQIQELQRKHRNNPQELMAAQQALYREHGVSMYGGCLPLLVQMPFLYGLYFSLYSALIPPKGAHKGVPAAYDGWSSLLEKNTHWAANINKDIYPFLPHLTIHTLPNTAFLWANLAAPDPLHILPILAGVLTFIQMRMAQPVRRPLPPGQRPDANTQTMSSMMYIMPFFTFFIGLNFPAGLAFYWCISTAFSAVQQYFLSGLGSLFVGLEPLLARLNLHHLIPEPQALPVLPPRPSASASAAPASRIVDADPSGARPAGLGGFGALLRQLTTSAQEAAAQRANSAAGTDKTNGKLNGNGTGGLKADDARSLAAASDGSGGNGAKDSGARRPRSERAAPMLVKPPSVDQNGTNGTNGTKDASASASKSASNQAKSQPARRPAGGPGGRSGPGGSGARRRSGGRPKGGK